MIAIPLGWFEEEQHSQACDLRHNGCFDLWKVSSLL